MNLEKIMRRYYQSKLRTIPLPNAPRVTIVTGEGCQDRVHDGLGILTLAVLWMIMINPQSLGVMAGFLPGVVVFIPAAM